MSVHQSDIATGILRSATRWQSTCFFVQGTSRQGNTARVDLDRSEALHLRRMLNVYLRETNPRKKGTHL